MKRNGNEQKLHLMVNILIVNIFLKKIKRIQSGDSYNFNDEAVKNNIKEEYFHKYLNFMRQKIFD